MYTPPSLSHADGPLATLQVPADTGGANWPGGAMDPETNRLYIHSHTAVYAAALVPADPAVSDFGYVGGFARANAPARRRRRARRCGAAGAARRGGAGRGGGRSGSGRGGARRTCRGCR